jgi:FKBP-type peptidyl-prolyl cis-trans isomerase SlyD
VFDTGSPQVDYVLIESIYINNQQVDAESAGYLLWITHSFFSLPKRSGAYSMSIEENKVVGFLYTLKNGAGEVLDHSEEDSPLHYLHGHNNIIPGLENEMVGKQVGDTFTAVISPDQAYGEYSDSLVQVVEKDSFQGIDEVQVGMQFSAQLGGQMRIITIKDVQGDEVTFDANHPLAGETLHFDVEVVEVRDATDEELTHGHVHGEHGHH